jgi:hypothetical protein
MSPHAIRAWRGDPGQSAVKNVRNVNAFDAEEVWRLGIVAA